MTTTLILGALVSGVAGFVQGCGGFGLGLTAAPTLMLVLHADGRFVTPVVLTLSICNSFIVLLDAHRHVQLRLVVPLVCGGILGAPLGIGILRVVDPAQFKFGVGVFVVLVAGVLLSGWRKAVPNAVYTLFPVGLASGILGGATAMGGPPAILFLANQRTPKDTFRASLIAFFFSVSCFTIGVFFWHGMYTAEVARTAIAFMPVMAAGTWLGVRTARHVPDAIFRTAVIIAAGLMGMMLVLTSM